MDATRDRLLMAAGEVFAEKGFEKATVREICQAANVQNIAAVNYYFGDKERLYIESVKRAHQVQIDLVPLPKWAPGTTPEKKLHDFVETMVTRLTGDSWLPWQEQLMMREVANPTAAVAELVQQFIRPHFELLLSIIDEFVPAATPATTRHQIAFQRRRPVFALQGSASRLSPSWLAPTKSPPTPPNNSPITSTISASPPSKACGQNQKIPHGSTAPTHRRNPTSTKKTSS